MWEDSQIWDQHWGQGSHHVDDHPLGPQHWGQGSHHVDEHPLGQLWGEPLAALRHRSQEARPPGQEAQLAPGLAAAAAAEEARRALAASLCSGSQCAGMWEWFS